MRVLAAILAIGLMSVSALANTPTGGNFSAVPGGISRMGPGQYPSDTYGDSTLQPFQQQRRALDAGIRPLTGRHGGNLLAPHIDAGGVPDPRI